MMTLVVLGLHNANSWGAPCLDPLVFCSGQCGNHWFVTYGTTCTSPLEKALKLYQRRCPQLSLCMANPWRRNRLWTLMHGIVSKSCCARTKSRASRVPGLDFGLLGIKVDIRVIQCRKEVE